MGESDQKEDFFSADLSENYDRRPYLLSVSLRVSPSKTHDSSQSPREPEIGYLRQQVGRVSYLMQNTTLSSMAMTPGFCVALAVFAHCNRNPTIFSVAKPFLAIVCGYSLVYF